MIKKEPTATICRDDAAARSHAVLGTAFASARAALEAVVDLIEYTENSDTHAAAADNNRLGGEYRDRWGILEPAIKEHLWNADSEVYTPESVEERSRDLLQQAVSLVRAAQADNCGFAGDNEDEWRMTEAKAGQFLMANEETFPVGATYQSN